MKKLKALSLGEGLGEAAFVDEYKPAGTYEVEFNAVGLSRNLSLTSGVSARSGYASCIYFYQLTTGGYSITKQMLLMK